MAATVEIEGRRASSSTIEEMRFTSEQESQTADWDEVIPEHHLSQKKRFDLSSRFLRNVNRLHKTQGGWWEFGSSPDAIIEMGANTYFVESKSVWVRSLADVWPEATTRDTLERNLRSFSHTKSDEEPSMSALMESFVKGFRQLRLQEEFAQFLSNRRKRLVTKKHSILRGSPQAVLQAMDASPRPTDEAVNELLRIIKEQEKPSTFEGILDEH